MLGKSINFQILYLGELIDAFPTQSKISPHDALEKLRIRYESVESNINEFSDFIIKFSKMKLSFLFPEMIKDNDYFPMGFLVLIRILHSLLFQDILSNAGKVRKANDPNFGFVGFGGLSNRVAGHTKYCGSNPNNINEELRKAVMLLKKMNDDPIRAGLEFYRKFVKIHPFYEANGRIARIILSIYLQYHGYYITWREIEVKRAGKFISKLNKCHTHENKPTYDKYFNLFVDFFRPFIHSIEDLNITT